jgi:hypothetical protein
MALAFGAITRLEMVDHWTPEQNNEVAKSDDMADLCTAEFGLKPPHRLATQVISTALGRRPSLEHHGHGMEASSATDPKEAIEIVAARIAGIVDYIKIITEGSFVSKTLGLSMLANDTLLTATGEAPNRHSFRYAIFTKKRDRYRLDATLCHEC